MARSFSTVTVWESVIDAPEWGEGPAADGTHVVRFLDEAKARAFLTGRTYYGRPATLSREDVPRRLAERWRFLG